jgi:hypothetical protein
MSSNSNNAWKPVSGKNVQPAAYVVPSMRKAPEPTFDEMFPVGLVTPDAKKPTVAWGNFKEAVQKVANTDNVHVDKGVLASFTNPLTGYTIVVRDLVRHPNINDCDDSTDINNVLPKFSSKKNKPVIKRLVADDDIEYNNEDEKNEVVDDTYDSFSEDEFDITEEEVINDDGTYVLDAT